jgi:hypothetical protein
MSDDQPLAEELTLPTGVDVLGLAHENICANLANDTPGGLDLPSQWRMAKLVVTGRAPLRVYRFTEET